MDWSYHNGSVRIIRNKKSVKKVILIIPFVLTLIVSGFLLFYLLQNKDPKKPPSALLNEDVPKIEIPDLFNEKNFLTNVDFKDKLILVNFFASWCAPCKVEHPLFFKIKEDHPNLSIIGVDYKDLKNDALDYLKKDGNPYNFVGYDKQGLIGLEFGVFGLPETFLINKKGKIIYKHLGPLDKKIIENDIYPLLN